MNNQLPDNPKHFDTCVVGGGLAGLSSAILLAKQGHRVILFEKETYPFHKVCGEYISMESRDFLISLGLVYQDLNLPVINRLLLTAPNGNALQQPLPLGGFGISRRLLDNQLKILAEKAGVIVLDGCKVLDIQAENGGFKVLTKEDEYWARSCLGAFGKRSLLDVKWRRPFINQKGGKLHNLVAVKYHIQTNAEVQTIALHQFRNGYCGLSAIEEGRYCLCYLTRASEMKPYTSVGAFEKAVLWKNPHLREVLSTCAHYYDKPLTIAQVSFHKKSQVENGILLMGDAAGLIAPLCGNGMSMALHAGKMAAELTHQFLQGNLSRLQMEQQYISQWKLAFGQRLIAGRLLQGIFGNPLLSNIFVAMVKKMPRIGAWLIKQTHGQPF